MKCNEFKNIVVDLFDKEVDPQVKDECERHLSECAECRKYYDGLLEAADLLRLKTKKDKVSSALSFKKLAAMFISILVLSGIAYAAIHIVSQSRQAQQTEQTSVKVRHQQTITESQAAPVDTLALTYVFENVPLDEIIKDIVLYYHKAADIKNEQAHNLRLYYKWDRTATIESVVDDLNHFNHVNISIEDNKLIVNP
jgi:hypothetical protein